MDFIKEIIVLIKGKKINAVGVMLIIAGISGTSSPYWYPLVEDIIRSSLNIASNTEKYTQSNIVVIFSILTVLLGVFLILFNRVLEHKESLHRKEQESKPAFKASDEGDIELNGCEVNGYSGIIDAKNKGRFKAVDTKMER
mgnify:CR=1 FL=1